MPFTLTDHPQFNGLEVSLRNIFMIGLFFSNSRMVIFSKTKKNSHHSKHLRNPNVHMEEGWVYLNICHVFANYFFQKQMIYCSFFVDGGGGGLGSQYWSFWEDVINI